MNVVERKKWSLGALGSAKTEKLAQKCRDNKMSVAKIEQLALKGAYY